MGNNVMYPDAPVDDPAAKKDRELASKLSLLRYRGCLAAVSILISKAFESTLCVSALTTISNLISKPQGPRCDQLDSGHVPSRW